MPNAKMSKMLPATDENIRIAACVLREGGLVAFPTETVYGLGATALDRCAVQSIFTAKGRPQDNPLIVHVDNTQSIFLLVKNFSEHAKILAEAFWPGPLTLILPRSNAIDPSLSAGLDSVAVRIPSHPVARQLIACAGVPVAAPSANRSGRPSPTSAAHCTEDLWGRVDIILDGGECPVGVESTVISLIGEVPCILRPGGITLCEIEQIIGRVEVDPAVYREIAASEAVSSPGMKHRHYAPKAKTALVHGSLEEFIAFCRERSAPGMWAMVFDEDLSAHWDFPVLSYGSEQDSKAQASRLFAALRELDEKGAQTVYIRAPQRTGLGLAVYNRLLRAASFTEYNLGEDSC
jgi:L-threonylcarbamoyladenylate synthase